MIARFLSRYIILIYIPTSTENILEAYFYKPYTSLPDSSNFKGTINLWLFGEHKITSLYPCPEDDLGLRRIAQRRDHHDFTSKRQVSALHPLVAYIVLWMSSIALMKHYWTHSLELKVDI